MNGAPRFLFSGSALDLPTLQRPLHQDECGGYASFEGWVRNHNDGLAVTRLEYEAFEALASREGERIIAEACEKFAVQHAHCVHRIGSLAIGDIAVWVGVSAPHRDEAFRACRYIIDEVKHRLPIWKKEHYLNGDSDWVNCERCAAAPAAADAPTHQHDHSHPPGADHAPAHLPRNATTAHAAAPQPDYSRQMALREVGAAGQQKLRASAVTIVGAGGLGVPVMQYLAGAGVGRMTIIDGDRLEASNLHRQTLYALSDCGAAKAELAATRLRALNPQIDVVAHVARLAPDNGAALLADSDLIIDCSDNFSTKFLLNDLAQQLGKPVIFASVYQFEGQLQVLDPSQPSSCLRCIWPEATRDGLVGNCAEAGVLGPVPGVLGSLQALEALKLLLDLPGRLRNELLMIDLTTLSTARVRARRNDACGAGPCVRSAAAQAARQSQPTEAAADIELHFSSLDAATGAGFSLIDIREAEELRTHPTPTRAARHLPLAELLAGRNLPGDHKYLLVCARGSRSLAAAHELRARGLRSVYSLRGGVLGLGD